jgi:hypothetical protein
VRGRIRRSTWLNLFMEGSETFHCFCEIVILARRFLEFVRGCLVDFGV